ncbi:hypothetical protein BS47DRAFT_1489803 [Hydnum rufescens UP504]|uniref:Uncharacterized protein n=1 Tax=Hydnum rufescens UP504 TaxID=1448309 RepID=A0A9P6AGZ1_9AGAM|nr:hypothetical protein BS47DRAFT_1489803 [Hydnum rufescens UP504]
MNETSSDRPIELFKFKDAGRVGSQMTSHKMELEALQAKETPTLREWNFGWSHTRPEHIPDRADSIPASPHSRDGYSDVKEPMPSYPKPEERTTAKSHSPLLDKPDIDRTYPLSFVHTEWPEPVVAIPGKVAPARVVLHSTLNKEETHTSYRKLRDESEHVHNSAGSKSKRTAIPTEIFRVLMSAILNLSEKVNV